MVLKGNKTAQVATMRKVNIRKAQTFTIEGTSRKRVSLKLTVQGLHINIEGRNVKASSRVILWGVVGNEVANPQLFEIRSDRSICVPESKLCFGLSNGYLELVGEENRLKFKGGVVASFLAMSATRKRRILEAFPPQDDETKEVILVLRSPQFRWLGHGKHAITLHHCKQNNKKMPRKAHLTIGNLASAAKFTFAGGASFFEIRPSDEPSLALKAQPGVELVNLWPIETMKTASKFSLQVDGAVALAQNPEYCLGVGVNGTDTKVILVRCSDEQRKILLEPGNNKLKTRPASPQWMLSREDKDSKQVPFYWHIPKAGGTQMEKLLNLVYELPTSVLGDETDFNYVCKNELVSRNILQVVRSPRLDLADCLFKRDVRARMFTVMRHPVDRLVSLFYYQKVASWERDYDPSRVNATLDEFTTWAKRQSNWMTKQLAGIQQGRSLIQRGDLENAKAVLREHFYVGFLDDFAGAVHNFEEAFGWKLTPSKQRLRDTLLKKKANANQHPPLSKSDPSYAQLAKDNEFDIELYEYARSLESARKSAPQLDFFSAHIKAASEREARMKSRADEICSRDFVDDLRRDGYAKIPDAVSEDLIKDAKREINFRIGLGNTNVRDFKHKISSGQPAVTRLVTGKCSITLFFEFIT